MNKSVRLKGQLAYGSRRDVAYPPERLAELRREYHAARLAERIRQVLLETGPFTAEQARELTGIISPTQEAGELTQAASTVTRSTTNQGEHQL